MKKINLAITGCMGRMGQQLIKSANKNKFFKIVSLTENRIINKKILGIEPVLNSLNAFKKTDVIIDFTVPKCTLEILKIATKLRKKSYNWNYGFYKKRRGSNTKIFKKDSYTKSWKYELGCKLLMYLTEIASKSLGENFLSKVYEVHHKRKKDYPSGTA